MAGTNSLLTEFLRTERVVVGESTDASGRSHAFRWTQAGMVDLGNLPGGTKAIAHGISADGRVVVGESTYASGISHVFRSTEAGMIDLGILPGEQAGSPASQPTAV